MLTLPKSFFPVAVLVLAADLSAQYPPGEEPVLTGPRITQVDITSGALSLEAIRIAGMRIFSSPFNKLDGYGDGPMNPADPTSFGGRPTLQDNGTFLRVNGLDAQTCVECHSIVSAATVPFTFGIGGVGMSNSNAIFMPTVIDVADNAGNGYAGFNGRYINPPFLFGAGGIELLAKEMTQDLQRRKARAMQNPGQRVNLRTKGVNFGWIVFANNTLDTSNVVGVEHDLIIRPFGRKGELATVRAFDIDAVQFHLGMQPTEIFGAQDGDGDGTINEILVGELSALHIFNTNFERPRQVGRRNPGVQRGARIFESIGCADCHVPELQTESRMLTYSFPEVHDDPTANVFYAADISARPAGFRRNRNGGVRVPLFSDLKRHDMGAGLAESTGGPLDRLFITARLWGIADTAPYLHDGRATTLTEAIEAHGGEASAASAAFSALPNAGKVRLLTFLRTLKTPRNPQQDIIPDFSENEEDDG